MKEKKNKTKDTNKRNVVTADRSKHKRFIIEGIEK